MVGYLIIALCVVAVRSMRTAPLAFAIFTLLHDQLSICLDGWGYYISAGAVDVMSLAIIAIIARPSRTTTALVYICYASLFLNFYGWGLWLSYYPPVTYDISFITLYSIAIYVILRGDAARDEERNNLNFFHTFRDKGAMARRLLSKEARN